MKSSSPDGWYPAILLKQCSNAMISSTIVSLADLQPDYAKDINPVMSLLSVGRECRIFGAW
jgi:hypothetical protein